MGCKTVYGLLFVFLLSFVQHCDGVKSCLEADCVKPILDDNKNCCDWKAVFNNYAQDLIDVNRNVFTSLDTLKILTGVLPVYLVSRYCDDSIHSSFYNAGLHKNLAQMPEWLHTFASKAVTGLTVTFVTFPFLNGIHEEVRQTSSVMTMGAVSLSMIRNILKYSFKARSAFRPWHGDFSSSCRTLGGFPSGHMAMATYLASLYGLRHGKRWGFPLSVFASFVFATSLNGNRHYASQLVGGFGLGLMYGVASYKLLNSRFGSNTSIGLSIDDQNRTNLSLTYEF